MIRLLVGMLVYYFTSQACAIQAEKAEVYCKTLAYSNMQSSFIFFNADQLAKSAALLVNLEYSLSEVNQTRDPGYEVIVQKTKREKFRIEFKEFLNIAGEQGLSIYKAAFDRINGPSKNKEGAISAAAKRKDMIIEKETAELVPFKIKKSIMLKSGFINDANFVSDEKAIIIRGENKSIVELIEFSTGQVLKTFKKYLNYIVIKGHFNKINYAQISPDGKTLLTASDDKIAMLWDISTGKVINTFEGYASAVKAVQFSPDGNYIVTGYEDGKVILWDAKTEEKLKELDGHKGAVLSVQFSPDGKLLVTGSEDNTAIIWDAESGTPIHNLIGHKGGVKVARFSSNGKYIITGSGDTTAKMWDVATASVLQTFIGHTDWVVAAEFSPDSTLVLTASYDKRAIIWDIKTGNISQELNDKTLWYYSASFSKDGQSVYTAAAESRITIWSKAKDGGI